MKKLLPLLLALAGCDSAIIADRDADEVNDFVLPGTNPPLVMRWPSGSTVQVQAVSNAQRQPVLRAALEAGIEEWNRHALFGEYRLGQSTDLATADVIVRWSDEAAPVDLSPCPPGAARAQTTFCLPPEGDSLRVFTRIDGEPGRVKMVVTILGTQSADAAEVQRLLTHELGHVLGIGGHSVHSRDLMYGGRDLTTAFLSPRDLATIGLLYQLRPDITP